MIQMGWDLISIEEFYSKIQAIISKELEYEVGYIGYYNSAENKIYCSQLQEGSDHTILLQLNADLIDLPIISFHNHPCDIIYPSIRDIMSSYKSNECISIIGGTNHNAVYLSEHQTTYLYKLIQKAKKAKIDEKIATIKERMFIPSSFSLESLKNELKRY